MAGHSHWAGIKHKKGRQDKQRSKTFTKLSREITVAAKLGSKDPDTNPRLRTAIQNAKQFNMPKDNIERAIKKSEISIDQNFENITYEALIPNKAMLVIESLTDNKNRSVSSIRTILQKNSVRMVPEGSVLHNFFRCGVIQLDKTDLTDEKFLEIAAECGAKDCTSYSVHEATTEMEDFYKVKSMLENHSSKILYSGLEWRAFNPVELNEADKENVMDIISQLDEDDDVQRVFTNLK